MPPVDRTRRPRPSPPVHAEIVVSPVEAEHGGTMYVRVPLGAPCPGCAGTGGGWPPACCATCAGSGVVPDDVDLRIHIPPRIRDGAVLEIPIAEATHRAVRLRALVRVGG
jgi:DnaJ-class molecular chaperone